MSKPNASEVNASLKHCRDALNKDRGIYASPKKEHLRHLLEAYDAARDDLAGCKSEITSLQTENMKYHREQP